ncbi:hypothetical protein SPRG_02782 [Saprolegnia parasitica CBS 223.65]|uniref:Dynein axonemal assembly factor 5 TPR repeats domain-containing protein n=1 Tax=Saprolegnia parasitica (strain CBS 223.65) TaxID=695850 RepID=A0A067CP89_SAPPC|nr:hypothetical protein SPRG_02782 [Saprolegnia parasitica CBS 223.65]KDO32303.1 hypothetical protein SPRG_02782 [Saprolegnia parasitica CBS 223.65]|eukprot:XP_012196759.1 hypothetical protein SPRG_02782 [Saprolegnia parasitica CBS 223.65]
MSSMDEVWAAMKRENDVRPVAFRAKPPKDAPSTKAKKAKKPLTAMAMAKEDAARSIEVTTADETSRDGDLDELGDDVAAMTLTADDILIKHQRDLNCLSDEQQGVRKRAISVLSAVVAAAPPSILPALFPSFAKPLFKRFNDPVEKVRDTSIQLTTTFLLHHDNLLPILPYLMPAVVTRLGSPWSFDEKLQVFIASETLRAAHERGRIFVPEADVGPYKKPREPSEEVRGHLITLLHTLLEVLFAQQASSLLNAYVYDILCVLVLGVHDHCPDVAIRSCDALVPLSHNMVSVLKHFSVALVRACKHLLEHRMARVRVAAMRCIRDLVMVPNVEKCKGSGTEAIADLVAYQDENIIPVSAFYTHEVKVNVFAKLDQDANVSVRRAFYETIMAWLTHLPDRYDHEPRLMPYLLSAVADECAEISQLAMATIEALGKRYALEHPDDVIERTQYAVDGSAFCNFEAPYPSPFPGRPSLGTRLYIRGRCRRFINTLLRELSHWQGPSGCMPRDCCCAFSSTAKTRSRSTCTTWWRI